MTDNRSGSGVADLCVVIPALERLSSTLGDKDLVLIESRDAGSDTHVLALPLAYIYARHALVLESAKPDKSQLHAFLEQARPRYDRVLFIGGGGTDLLSRRIEAVPVGDGRVQIQEFEASPWNVYPREIRRKDFDYSIYQLLTGAGLERPFALDVGYQDDLNVVRFHAKEQTEGRTVRWTRAQSFVAITGITGPPRLAMHCASAATCRLGRSPRGSATASATGWISVMAAGAAAQRASTTGKAPALASTSTRSAAECSATTTIGPRSAISTCRLEGLRAAARPISSSHSPRAVHVAGLHAVTLGEGC